jgi:antitoxin PrlF
MVGAKVAWRHSFAQMQIHSISAILHVMKATLSISSRGVLTLPAKLRDAVGLRPDDPVIAETTPEGVLLRPAVTLPVEIYTDARIREFDAAEAELGQTLRTNRFCWPAFLRVVRSSSLATNPISVRSSARR